MTDAISVTTTPRKSPQLAVAGPYDLESPQLPPTIKNKLLAQPPVSLMTLFKSNVPRPDHIQPPAKGVTPEGYYVVWVGQEVGIFYTWDNAAERVLGVSSNRYKKYNNFDEALRKYRSKYELGAVQAVPIPGGWFWSEDIHSDDDDPYSALTERSWDALEALTDHLSHVL
ncbi:hypothetical protein SERLA73DRAFT_70553 [Serpula lacrymans var. lacrymans S7.3]|uniref:Ribonuclease H1 N-terminal domain-containing protein n=1 Tax=Serpula lacrymans var. lacrymans (strain S7.3) TaxID=936435 RepID=F8PNB0_SERL3|nr:hypothetical protein SERLA73DRAFT_70553 [Serpula lacrymans var. lacrymans S7.3]